MPVNLSSELVNLHAAQDADEAQQWIGVKVLVVSTCGKTEQQKQNPRNKPELRNAVVNLVRHQHSDIPSRTKTNYVTAFDRCTVHSAQNGAPGLLGIPAIWGRVIVRYMSQCDLILYSNCID